MTLTNHPLWFPFKATPGFIPTFPTQHQQVLKTMVAKGRDSFGQSTKSVTSCVLFLVWFFLGGIGRRGGGVRRHLFRF